MATKNGTKAAAKKDGVYECSKHGKITPYVCKVKATGRKYRRCPDCMKARRVSYQKRKKEQKILPWMGEGFTAEDREKARKAGRFSGGGSVGHKPVKAKKTAKAKKAAKPGIDYKARALKAAATRRAKKANATLVAASEAVTAA